MQNRTPRDIIAFDLEPCLIDAASVRYQARSLLFHGPTEGRRRGSATSAVPKTTERSGGP
jgi:hypothetical protein